MRVLSAGPGRVNVKSLVSANTRRSLQSANIIIELRRSQHGSSTRGLVCTIGRGDRSVLVVFDEYTPVSGIWLRCTWPHATCYASSTVLPANDRSVCSVSLTAQPHYLPAARLLIAANKKQPDERAPPLASSPPWLLAYHVSPSSSSSSSSPSISPPPVATMTCSRPPTTLPCAWNRPGVATYHYKRFDIR